MQRREEIFQQIEHDEDVSDEAEITIAHFLEQVSEGHLSNDTKGKIRQMLREIGELESIGDSCFRLARTIHRRDQQGKSFDDNQQRNLIEMMSLCDKALSQMNLVLNEPLERHDTRETYYYENNINTMRDRLKDDNVVAVNERKYDYAQGTAYGELVGELEKLGDYVVNVVEARFGQIK